MPLLSTRIRTQALTNSCLNHEHDYHQLVLAHRGSAEFEVTGQGGQVDLFHGCLVPSNEIHFYQGLGDNRHIILDVPLNTVSGPTQELFEKARYFKVDTSMRYLLSYMYNEVETWSYYPEAADGVVNTFLASLHQRGTHHTSLNYVSQSRIDMIALDDYIHDHIHESLSTSRLAAFCNVSTGHFHDLFRQVSGKTPGQYLFEARMKYARQLILSTRLPLIQVAEKVGFASQSALTHAYRRCYAQPPGQERRAMRE